MVILAPFRFNPGFPVDFDALAFSSRFSQSTQDRSSRGCPYGFGFGRRRTLFYVALLSCHNMCWFPLQPFPVQPGGIGRNCERETVAEEFKTATNFLFFLQPRLCP